MEFNIEDLMNGHSASDQGKSPVSEQPILESSEPPPAGINRYLHNPAEGMKLVAELITHSTGDQDCQGTLDKIHQLIDEEFLTLVSRDENSFGTKTYIQLHQIKQRLTELVSFPTLEQCYTVAVGGAFSAGKSRFLNSVLGCLSLLPTDTTPTTSIPTYISQGKENQITALNTYQKKTVIDEAALGAICHAFNDKFGVTFSHLLQLISVERKELIYPALAFLDTPGYSKTDNISRRSENTDENIAREQLSQADYLIWLIDIQNGTIPKPDIDFIASLELEQPILFVFSKADKKPETQVRDVLATARKDLNRAELPYHDVVGYSAQTGAEISDTGNVLCTMLDAVNGSKRGTTILWQLDRLLSQHISDYQTQRQSLKLTLGTLNELMFDDVLTKERKQHLSNIQQKTKGQLDELNRHEHKAEEIRKHLKEAVTELCEQLELTVSQSPTRIQLENRGQELQQQAESQRFSFTALIQGDSSQLANRSDLSRLQGSIERISPVGVFISNDLGLEIMITRQQLRTVLGNININDCIQPGMPVEIQITGNNKSLVHLEASINQ